MDRRSTACPADPRFSQPALAPGGVCSRTIISRTILALLAGAGILAGCDTPRDSPRAGKLAANAVPIHHDESLLRVRLDPARDRVWVLTLDHVAVYDAPTRQLIRQIELPPWSVAAVVCQPDIVFDAHGTAFIAHNLEPKLWQIHADTFVVKEHTLRLLGREHLDIGFANLAIGPEGALTGEASSGGSVWRIDLQRATARETQDAHVYGCTDASSSPRLEAISQ